MSDSSQSTSTKSNPWRPTLPTLRYLSNVINNYAHGGIQATDDQRQALRMMMHNAQNMQDFGGQATDITNDFLSGDPNGLLGPAYQSYKDALTPLATADLDPTKTPGLSNVLSTIRSDIGNDVNGLFAGAGRDLSGMHVQALGRGISQGEAVPLLNQYNQNVANRLSASNGLLGAAGATSTAMGANKTAGLNMVSGLPSIINQKPNQILQAAQMKKDLPLQNIAKLLGLTIPIAGLGGQSYSETQNNPSLMSTIGQGMNLAGTMLGVGGSMAGMGGMGGGFNPFGGFTGNYFPSNPAAAGAGYGNYGGQYYPMFR